VTMSDTHILDRLDSALANLRVWIEGGEWVQEYANWVVKFFSLLDQLTGKSLNEVSESVRPELMERALWACFEDFLTLKDEAGKSIVDIYLESHPDLDSSTVESLLAAKRSRVGLFEVVEVLEGDVAVLRDILNRGELFRVEGISGALVGQSVAVRVVRIGDVGVATQTVFPMESEDRDRFIQGYEQAYRQVLKDVPKYLRKDSRQIDRARDVALEYGAELATVYWLRQVLKSS